MAMFIKVYDANKIDCLFLIKLFNYFIIIEFQLMTYASNYCVFYHQINMLISYWCKRKLSLRLDSAEKYCVCVSSFLILSFFFFLRRAFHVHCGSHTGRESKIMFFQWVSCTIHGTHKYFIKKKYFKTESYSTIYIFKNYFQFLAKQAISKQTLNILPQMMILSKDFFFFDMYPRNILILVRIKNLFF